MLISLLIYCFISGFVWFRPFASERKKKGWVLYSRSSCEVFGLVFRLPFTESSWVSSKYHIFLIMVSYRGPEYREIGLLYRTTYCKLTQKS